MNTFSPASSSSPASTRSSTYIGGGSTTEPESDASAPAILFCEFLASFFFVFIGGSVLSMTGALENEARSYRRIVAIAIADGFAFYLLIYMVMKLTRGRSGYFNSALTLSLCLVDLYLDGIRAMWSHLMRAFAHLVAQILGSLVGAIMITLLVPWATDGVEKTGVAKIAVEQLTVGGAFGLEIFFSAFLVLLLLAVRNNENKKSSLLLAFGFIVCRLILFPLTGSTLNPARAIAHAIVANEGGQLPIFVFAPIIGATTATGAFIFMHRQDME